MKRHDRLNLGCGREIDPSACNVDWVAYPGVDLVCDIRQLPFETGSVREVIASSVLEHLCSPCAALDEIHRVLDPKGWLFVRVPALGTHAAHADSTHRFLADLKSWRAILGGYFREVRRGSEGVHFRDSKVLCAINHILVKVCRFHELAQVWTFHCSHKRERVRERGQVLGGGHLIPRDQNHASRNS